MKFSKYEGIGNDFVMIADPEDKLTLSPEAVRALCDRRFGIGGDGVIRVAPGTDGAELLMDYVNADGSIGEMCGNGIRCLALFAREQGMTSSNDIKVGTRAGIRLVTTQEDGRVRVDMGAPIFDPAGIPVRWEGPNALDAKIELEDQTLEAACLSMGNPHAVIFVAEPDDVPVATLGPAIEHHVLFPNKANAEFAVVESPTRVRMRVWERGSGETLACGTGAAATGVAAMLLADTERELTVALPGGELEVSWQGSTEREESVFMTGPAVKVFEGETDIT